MPKVLLYSDVHLHPHKCSTDRLRDCLKALRWVFDTAKEHGIENVICLGDMFHDRSRIDVPTYQWSFDILKEYLLPDAPFHLYLLMGNHDMWQYKKWEISSIKPLSVFDSVTVIDKPCTLEIAGHPISFLPYTMEPDKDLANILNPGKFRILMGHVAISGAILNTMYGIESDVVEHDSDMKKVEASVFDGWHQVFLGHYHAQQKVTENVEYVGSPLQLSFGEAFQHKHIIIYDLETHEKQYIRNKFSPQHFVIPEEDLSKYELNGNFIRVAVDNLSKSGVVDMRNKILKENKVASLKIVRKARPVANDVVVVEGAKAIMLNESKMIERWIELFEKQNGLGNLDRSKLLDMFKQVCAMRKKAA